MPLPRALARFNARYTNRLMLLLAGWMPGFAVMSHVGRKSGRRYRTPVNMFRSGGAYVVALTYGPDSEWVRNVLAAGGCEVTTQGQTVRLHSPRVVEDPTRHTVPLPARLILRLAQVRHFLWIEGP